jgi:hypothetical protein
MRLAHARFLVVGAIATVFALSNAVAGKNDPAEPHVFHWQLSVNMVPSGVESNASGRVKAKVEKEGNSYNQKLTVSVKDLKSRKHYQLWAQVEGSSNFVEVAGFTTKHDGHQHLKFVKKGTGKGHAGGKPLPAILDPIGNIVALEIANMDTQTVLTANLTAPKKLDYELKRRLHNDGVEPAARATVSIHVTDHKEEFNLDAHHLMPAKTYFLALNGVIATNLMSKADGNLAVRSLPARAPAALDIASLAILNSQTNSILSTTLP